MDSYKKLYEESIVKEIMISTALYVQELLQEDNGLDEEDLCILLEENYSSIIEETLAAESEEE